MVHGIWSLPLKRKRRQKEDLEVGEQLLLLDPLRDDQVLKKNSHLPFAFCIKYVGSEVVALSLTFAFFIHSLMLP